MFIADNREPKTIDFSELEDGDCFVYPAKNIICLKLMATPYSDFNAVNLETGEPLDISCEERIAIVQSRIEVW
jgi:hypothetical protein